MGRPNTRLLYGTQHPAPGRGLLQYTNSPCLVLCCVPGTKPPPQQPAPRRRRTVARRLAAPPGTRLRAPTAPPLPRVCMGCPAPARWLAASHAAAWLRPPAGLWFRCCTCRCGWSTWTWHSWAAPRQRAW